MHFCVHFVCNFIGFCVSKSVHYGLEKKNEEPVNRCGTMKNPPPAAKQQIAEMVEVRGVEPLHKNKKCIAVQSLFAFCVHFRVQNIVKEIVHHVVNSLFFIGHCVLVDFF